MDKREAHNKLIDKAIEAVILNGQAMRNDARTADDDHAVFSAAMELQGELRKMRQPDPEFDLMTHFDTKAA